MIADWTRSEARTAVAPLLQALPERERIVISLTSYEGLTQGEIGEAIGVGRSHVSRILDRVLDGLRHLLDTEAPDDLLPRPECLTSGQVLLRAQSSDDGVLGTGSGTHPTREGAQT